MRITMSRTPWKLIRCCNRRSCMPSGIQNSGLTSFLPTDARQSFRLHTTSASALSDSSSLPPVSFTTLPLLEAPYLDSFRQHYFPANPVRIPKDAFIQAYTPPIPKPRRFGRQDASTQSKSREEVLPGKCLEKFISVAENRRDWKLDIEFFRSLEKDSDHGLGLCMLERSAHSDLSDMDRSSTMPAKLIEALDYLYNVAEGVQQFDPLYAYLPQHPIDGSSPLYAYVRPPELVFADRGDIYLTALWAGLNRSVYTPVHWDPNPNLFLQVLGEKTFRILPPRALQGGCGMTSLEEFKKREGLENWIWGKRVTLRDTGNNEEEVVRGFEIRLSPGEGLFLPRGWWHSVRALPQGLGDKLGFDNEVNVSVNWWFR